MLYYPNEKAIYHLLEISRELDRMGVTHRMRIVGRTNAAVREAAVDAPSVDIVGEVPLVAPFLQQAALAPIPLTLGGGTRLKILEALSFARPVLSTPIGIEGIEVENGVEAVVEPDMAAFPAQIAALLGDRRRAQGIAHEGWKLVRDHYSPEALTRIVGSALRDLGLAVAKPSAKIFADNIGARVSEETIRFNAHSRLLTWAFLVRLSAGFEAVTAEFMVAGSPQPPNAFVTLRRRERGFTHVDVAAILPAEVEPSRAEIQISAWGRPVMRHGAPVDVPEERAGLLALEPSAEGFAVLAWSTAPEETLHPPACNVRHVPTTGATNAGAMRLFCAQVARHKHASAYDRPERRRRTDLRRASGLDWPQASHNGPAGSDGGASPRSDRLARRQWSERADRGSGRAGG